MTLRVAASDCRRLCAWALNQKLIIDRSRELAEKRREFVKSTVWMVSKSWITVYAVRTGSRVNVFGGYHALSWEYKQSYNALTELYAYTNSTTGWKVSLTCEYRNTLCAKLLRLRQHSTGVRTRSIKLIPDILRQHIYQKMPKNY